MKINWITIKVFNLEKSIEFYRDYLGMKHERQMKINEFMSIVFLKAENGMEIELVYNEKAQLKTIDNDSVSIGVFTTEYEKLLLQAREKGILTAEPAKLGGSLECFFVNDPNGVSIQIVKG